MLASFPDNASRLRRSKSVSTVNPNPRPNIPDHVDPWVAQQQALLAATTAYERANAGVAPTRMTATSTALPRTKSNTSRRSEGSHLAKRGSALRYSLEEHPRSHLGRRNTIQTSASKSDLMSGGLPSQAMGHVPSASGPHLRGKLSLSSLATPTRSVTSEPVRTGLRKARSMFYASSRQTTDNNEDTCSLTLIDPTLAMETPQKLTALPPFPSHSVPPVQSQPLPVTHSRHQAESGRSGGRDRSSGIFTPFKKLHSISSRKSSRTEAGSVSFNSIRSNGTVHVQEPSQVPTLHHKKSRSFSGNFKDKLMKVFRRTPTSTQQEMPAQQVGASRNYYYNSSKTTNETLNALGDGSKSSRSSLHPSRPPTPPFPRDPSNPLLSMRQGSFSSDGTSSSQSKSRVTSWTDSTAGHAATKDPKRLSIIHEVSRPSIVMPVPTRSATLLTRSVLESGLEEEDTSSQRQYPVEPRRVYSALMKEMARKEIEVLEVSRVEFDQNGNPVASVLDSLPSQQYRKSVDSGTNETNRMTIRTVTPDHPPTLSRTSSVRGRILIPPVDLTDVREESSGDEFPQNPADGCSLYAMSHRNSSSVGRLQRSQRANPPSAVQRAARAERASQRWKSPLDDGRRSLERASCEALSMTASNSFLDLRQDLAETSKAVTSDEEETFRTPKAGHITHDDSIADGIVLPKSRTPAHCVSPSIYSQHTSSQQSFFNLDSVTNLPNAISKGESGSAVIITSHPVSSWVIGTPTFTGKRISHSARSSKDWKAWLSKEVADLEQLSAADLAFNELEFKQQGHRRERTQISEDDEQSVSSAAPSCMPKLSRPKMESRPGSRVSSRMNDRFPMIETGRRGSSQSVATLRSVRKRSPTAITPDSTTVSTKGSSKENAPIKRVVSPFPRISRLATSSPRSVAGCMSSSHVARSSTQLPNAPVTPATPSPARARKLGRRISKAKSALEMHAQYSSPDLLRNKIIRKQAGCSPQFEGDTLRMILEGPYSNAKSPSPLKRVENSPMVSKFSEIGLDETGSVRSHASSAATPGHRLADIFLKQRKSGEIIDDNSVAFL